MSTLDPNALRQFTGTENYYRHALVRNVLYTDGAKYVADTAGAHWLLDKIATLQYLPDVSKESFQVWKLAVKGSAGTLVCEDGNGTIVHRESVTFTDFPEPGIELWCEKGECPVILLPSEH